MEPIDLLRKGDVATFNRRRTASARLEMFAEDLAGLELKGVDLSGVNLDKSDLTGTDLTEGRIAMASLAEIDGGEIVLARCLGIKVRLRDAFLEDAELTGADLSRGDLSGAQLARSSAAGCKLVGVRLKDASVTESMWPDVDLSEATLGGADFTGTLLTRVKLTDTKGAEVVFAGARLDGAEGTGVALTRLKAAGASLVRARLPGADLTGGDFTGADLSGADLSGANLTNANFTGAKLRGAKLIEAAVDGAVFTDADLGEVDLSGLDPAAMGLSNLQIEGLAAFGARYVADAPLVYTGATVAVDGATSVALWLNPDKPDQPSLRWAMRGPDIEMDGVVPVSGPAVLAQSVLSWQGRYVLVALVSRADGVVIMSWTLGTDGELVASPIVPLGFEPMVVPCFRVDADGLWMWNLARRGPTVVVHRDSGAGWAPVASEARPQARFFFGSDHPVLVCKAGIINVMKRGEVGAPIRVPDFFPTTTSVALPGDGRLLAVWVAAKAPRDAGGIRTQWLGGRQAEEIERFTENPDVRAIDGAPVPGGGLLVWIEGQGVGAKVKVGWTATEEILEIPETAHVVGVRFVPEAGGASPKHVTLTDAKGHLRVVTLEGQPVVNFG